MERNERFQLEVSENKDRVLLFQIHELLEFYLQPGSVYYIPNVNVYLLNWKEAHNILVIEKGYIKQHVQKDPIFCKLKMCVPYIFIQSIPMIIYFEPAARNIDGASFHEFFAYFLRDLSVQIFYLLKLNFYYFIIKLLILFLVLSILSYHIYYFQIFSYILFFIIDRCYRTNILGFSCLFLGPL